MSEFKVRARISTGLTFKIVEKAFKTDAARVAWLDKMESAGRLVQVLGFQDPEACAHVETGSCATEGCPNYREPYSTFSQR